MPGTRTILLVSGPEDLKEVYEDRRFLAIKAVKSRRVYVAPCAAHLWANRTVEQPLTVLWAAKIFYPELFKNLDLVKEMEYFYGRFFHYRMSDWRGEGNPEQRILNQHHDHARRSLSCLSNCWKRPAPVI